MPGYSGTPLARKLGLAPAQRALLVGAPPGFADTLGPLPVDLRLRTRAAGELDLVLLFVRRSADLARRFPPLAARLAPAGMLWVAWPKRTSGVPTDLSFDVVQRTGLQAGLVDTKVCAVDEVWSGLRFVIRKSDRRPGNRAARK
jgi:hypothetical protein